MEIDNLDIKL